MRKFPVLAALLAACPLSATAAESYDACSYEITTLPAVLSTQGTWCLKADRATAITSGAAITIAANNVTLDCNGFKLGGLQAGPLTGTSGILFNGRNNTTVRNCSIRGFKYGVNATDSLSTTIEDNRFESNTNTSVWLKGVVTASSVVARNRISDMVTPDATGNITGIAAEGGVDIVDNFIDGLRSGNPIGDLFPAGIAVDGGHGAVVGNRIRGLVATGEAESYGIFVSGSTLTIDRNYVDVDISAVTGYGIYCYLDNSLTVENRLIGNAVPVAFCAQSNNYVDTD